MPNSTKSLENLKVYHSPSLTKLSEFDSPVGFGQGSLRPAVSRPTEAELRELNEICFRNLRDRTDEVPY